LTEGAAEPNGAHLPSRRVLAQKPHDHSVHDLQHGRQQIELRGQE
jgi:hypothetical protein